MEEACLLQGTVHKGPRMCYMNSSKLEGENTMVKDHEVLDGEGLSLWFTSLLFDGCSAETNGLV